MKITAHLRSLRGDRRWGAFLKKMGLEDSVDAKETS